MSRYDELQTEFNRRQMLGLPCENIVQAMVAALQIHTLPSIQRVRLCSDWAVPHETTENQRSNLG